MLIFSGALRLQPHGMVGLLRHTLDSFPKPQPTRFSMFMHTDSILYGTRTHQPYLPNERGNMLFTKVVVANRGVLEFELHDVAEYEAVYGGDLAAGTRLTVYDQVERIL